MLSSSLALALQLSSSISINSIGFIDFKSSSGIFRHKFPSDRSPAYFVINFVQPVGDIDRDLVIFARLQITEKSRTFRREARTGIWEKSIWLNFYEDESSQDSIEQQQHQVISTLPVTFICQETSLVVEQKYPLCCY